MSDDPRPVELFHLIGAIALLIACIAGMVAGLLGL